MKKMNVTKALTLAVLAVCACGHGEKYSWEKDLQHRLEVDFSKSGSEVMEYVRRYVPEMTDSEMEALTEDGRLESMMLGGERKYFRNAAPNLFRIDRKYKAIKDSISGPEKEDYHALGEKAIMLTAKEIRGRAGTDTATAPVVETTSGYLSGDKYLGQPRRFRVKYKLTLYSDAVPDGETVRCWLPYPRTDVPRQKDVRFIEAGWTSRPANSSSPEYFRTADKGSEQLTFSGDGCAHSTLYMEAKASAGWPTVFYEEFEYTAYAEWFPLGIVPEDTGSGQSPKVQASGSMPRDFTGERSAHVIFTPEITALRDSLCRGIQSPVLKAKAFYDWIDASFPWASAREYSTIENIPAYVLKNRHGDCGQVSLLFITLCRSAGIPARFQSGFMMHPGHEGMHDWAEIWLDGYGWVPVDQSFGGEKYLGAIDPYRMIVNNDYGQSLLPAKKHPRSETVDFQRGEVEWKGGNLYFDNWDWDIEVVPAGCPSHP